ncbi:MAG: hypothetical protein JO326_06440 [Acetobacteraceae bacterium]|nr:hypothetical protein [Acetobacteraceae bacterium]
MNARQAAMIGAAALGFAALVAPPPAAAQVIYQTSPYPYGAAPFPYSDPSPYDQAFGTRPSFEIIPGSYGYAPAVRVVERCLYPNGWNVTDFGRDVNGIPPGIEHACPVPARAYGHIRARY